METRISNRRIIDIPMDVYRCLSYKADTEGEDVDEYIASVLRREAEKVMERMSDEEAYAWLSENEPDGHVMMDDEEQADFENWLGIKRK